MNNAFVKAMKYKCFNSQCLYKLFETVFDTSCKLEKKLIVLFAKERKNLFNRFSEASQPLSDSCSWIERRVHIGFSSKSLHMASWKSHSVVPFVIFSSQFTLPGTCSCAVKYNKGFEKPHRRMQYIRSTSDSFGQISVKTKACQIRPVLHRWQD